MKFVGAQAIGSPRGRAGAADTSQVGAVRTRRSAAPEPVVPEHERFEARQHVVRVDDDAVPSPGGLRDAGVGSHQLAPRTADAATGLTDRSERRIPRLGVDGVVPTGNGRTSPTGVPVPATIGVVHRWNERQGHQLSGKGDPALDAVEDGHESVSTAYRTRTSAEGRQVLGAQLQGAGRDVLLQVGQ